MATPSSWLACTTVLVLLHWCHSITINPLDLSSEFNSFGRQFFGLKENAESFRRRNNLTDDFDAIPIPAGRRTLYPTSLTIPPSEYDALFSIYGSNGGDSWLWTPGNADGIPWNFSSTVGGDPCIDGWEGVDCFCPVPDTVCFVVQLDLFGKYLTGEIDPALSSLSYLAYLNLGGNSLTGTIPADISALHGLQYLFLYVNALSGDIPVEIYGMSNLLYLVLGQNIDFNNAAQIESKSLALTGSIPSDVQNLTNLEYFFVYDTLMTGTIPTELGSLTHLKAIVMGGSPFTGVVPSVLGQLDELVYLVLGLAKYTGTIPSALQSLTSLNVLSINSNQLTGTVPLGLYSLPNVQLWYLYSNHLTGSLPSEISGLTSLYYFDMGLNQLTGNFPAEIAQLSALSLIELAVNKMGGSLPSIFGSDMPALSYLNIAYNSFSSTIPSGIGGMHSLNYFNVSYNSISGGIPSSFGSLPNIAFVSFQRNCMSGSIPVTLGSLASLEYLDIGTNRFAGTIPSFMCTHWESIITLNMSFNQFTGGIPPCLALLNQSLVFMDLSHNPLTGSIPSELGGLSRLQYLHVGNAGLIGTIPSQLSSISTLIDLRLNNNRLHGPINLALCTLSYLSYLDLSANRMGGPLPTSCFSTLSNIEYVFLQHNQFHGSLSDIIDPLTQSKLLVFDVGGNEFTGNLPPKLFMNSPLLRAFSAIKNCLRGQLPNQLCDATSLVSLALDGIGASSACQNKYLSFSDAYTLSYDVEGTIPRCLYSMPHLALLHLSGNGISDSIPQEIVITTSLLDLVLSHNLMHGPIPRQVQEKEWLNLDLSFNKFSGTLVPNISRVRSNSALFLNVNRISGEVPLRLRNAKNISILDGNLFSCALYSDDSSLPEHDDHSAVYQCADTFQQLSFVWASPFFLSLIAVTLILVVLQLKSSAVTNWVKDKISVSKRWVGMLSKESVLKSGRTNTVYLLLNFIQDFRLTSLVISGYILFILMPTWLILNHYFSTYEYLYAWTVSSAYLSGVTPAIVLVIALTGMLVCVFFLYHDNIQKDSSRKTSLFVGAFIIESQRDRAIQCVSLVLVALLNCCTIFIVNMVYVYIIITYNRVYATLAALAMAGFNLIWNNVVVVKMLNLLKDALVPSPDQKASGGRVAPGVGKSVSGVSKGASVHAASEDIATTPDSTLQRKFQSRAVVLSCLLELMNKIAIPCIATAAVSSTCFRSYLISPRVISATYDFTVCQVQPFISYSCQVFADVEVCNSVEGVFHQCKGKFYSERETSYDPPFQYSYQCSAIFISSYAASYVYMFIVVAFGIPLAHSMLLHFRQSFKPGSRPFELIERALPPALRSVREDFVLDRHRHLFDQSRFVITSVSYTAILVTFGAVFPPLALVICFAIVCKSHVSILTLGRMLEKAEEMGINRYRNTLLEECQDVAKIVGHQIWLIVPFAAIFYSFFIFDAYGDAMGYEAALIPAVCMAAGAPLLLFIGKRVSSAYDLRHPPQTKRSIRNRSPTKAFISPNGSFKITPTNSSKTAWISEGEDLSEKSEIAISSNSRNVAGRIHGVALLEFREDEEDVVKDFVEEYVDQSDRHEHVESRPALPAVEIDQMV